MKGLLQPFRVSLALTLALGFGPGCATVSGSQETSTQTPDKETPVKPLELPEVQRFQLDNGLTILVVENHQVPYAAFRLLMKAGSLQDPEGKEGLAKMTAGLLTYGTTTRTEDEISKKVDFLGATLGAVAGGSNIQVYGDITTVKKSNLRSFFDLMTDVVLNPVFPDEGMQRLQTRMIGALTASKDDNSTLANRAFAMNLFKNHPYSRMANGHPQTLGAITRDDVLDYHQRYFLPEHAVLGVSGDVNPEEIVAWAKEAFSAEWGSHSGGERICIPAEGMESTCEAFKMNGTTVHNARLTLPEKADALEPGIKIVVVDRDDPSLNQVQWRMGHQGVHTFDAPDWFDFRLGTQLLGGDFTARLNQVLRVREGLTYGARLNVGHAKRVPGKVAVSTYVKPKDLRRAIELALTEMENVVKEPVPAVELQSFKSKIIESLPFRFETANDTLAEYISLIAGDRNVSFLENYPVGISKVTSEGAQQALARGVKTDALLLVVVANASIVEELQPLVDARGGSIEVIHVESLYQE